MRSMLPYLVHAHRYAETKLPHSIGGEDDLDRSIALAESHLSDPTVADVLLASTKDEIALLLKGEPWVFDQVRVGLLRNHVFHDIRALLEERGLRSALELYGLFRGTFAAQPEAPAPSAMQAPMPLPPPVAA